MSRAGAGLMRWLSECARCFATFYDSAETAGVCPLCGHENHYTDEDL